MLAPKRESVLSAFSHDLAALDDDGAKARLRQNQGREQPTRTETNHHRAFR